MALITELTPRLVAAYTGSGDLATPSVPLDIGDRIRMTSGTTTGKADLMWSDTRTLAASGTEDLDLAGSLTDAFGTAFTVVKLKLVYVTADDGNTNDVQITRPASNGVPLFLAAGDGLAVGPGGCFVWCAPAAGVAVTAATGDLITFTNSAGSTGVTYSVVLIGTSA